MADFCQQCSISTFGEDFRELARLIEYGFTTALCEGCGMTVVDSEGRCRWSHCPVHGEENRLLYEDALYEGADSRL